MNLDPGTIFNGLIVASLVGLVADHFRLNRDLSDTKIALANLRTHVAEQYVRSPEVAKLSEEIQGLRHSFEEGMKVIYQLHGAMQAKSGG